MSGITIGLVGDIIAVGKIALQLAQALSDSRGSTKEYRALMKELRAFDQALLQVVALWQNYEDSPPLTEMGTITKDIALEFRETLIAFRLKVDKRYGTSLAAGGSGNWAKDAAKKVGWLKEKEDILELRRKLQMASNTITLFVLAAMGKSNKLESTAQALRVELVHKLLEESTKRAEEQTTQLRFMDEKLETQAKTLDMILATVKSGVINLSQVRTIAIDMKNLLSLLQSHMLAQQGTPRTIGGCWQQAPVILEDALGFVIPIPLELVNSWDMFEIIIAKRFEKHPGHGKIQRGEFAVEEESTGTELSRRTELTMCLSPGQKIDMSVIFNETSVSNNCPGCSAKPEASSETRNRCKSCNMWFQRVVEIEEVDETIEVSRLSDRQPQPHNAVQRLTSPIIGPADFQRVKLMRKQALLRNLDIQAKYKLERARKEVDENPREAQPKPAQEQLTDPSITRFLQYAVSTSDELTDPATEKFLREAILSS